MIGPKRIQLSRRKGWRMPPNTVNVARPGPFGNPWTIKGARAVGYLGADAKIAAYCVSLYRDWLASPPRSLTQMLYRGEEKRAAIFQGLPGLRGKNLACWCPLDQPCHADVLLDLANAPDETSDPAHG